MFYSQDFRSMSHSIESVSNLRLADFRYRYVICEDVWITFCDHAHYSLKPLGNLLVEGFGIDVPVAGERSNGNRCRTHFVPVGPRPGSGLLMTRVRRISRIGSRILRWKNCLQGWSCGSRRKGGLNYKRVTGGEPFAVSQLRNLAIG